MPASFFTLTPRGRAPVPAWQAVRMRYHYRPPGMPAPQLQEPAPGDTHASEYLPSPDFDGVWKEALRQWLPQCLELFWPHVHAQVNWRAPPVFLDKELKQIGCLVKHGTRHVDVLAQRETRSTALQMETWSLNFMDASTLNNVFRD